MFSQAHSDLAPLAGARSSAATAGACQLDGIPSRAVEDHWPSVEPFIARALGDAPHFTPGHIKEACRNRDMSLWALRRGGELVGCVVTQVVAYPRVKVCRVVLASAVDGMREQWMPLRGRLEAWARANGCSLVEVFGRPGWARVVPGAKVKTVLTWGLE